MSQIIPNTFQCPNYYCDHLMYLLTGDEWKVLQYTVRRIMGFHKRQDHISLSQYTDGIKNKNGDHLDHGTGLSRDTVRNSLDFLIGANILVLVGAETCKEGRCYSLQMDSGLIDIAKLEKRRADRQDLHKRRMTNVQIAAQENKDKEAATVEHQNSGVCQTARQGSVAQTTRGLSDSTAGVCRTATQNTVENQIESQLLLSQPQKPKATPEATLAIVKAATTNATASRTNSDPTYEPPFVAEISEEVPPRRPVSAAEEQRQYQKASSKSPATQIESVAGKYALEDYVEYLKARGDGKSAGQIVGLAKHLRRTGHDDDAIALWKQLSSEQVALGKPVSIREKYKDSLGTRFVILTCGWQDTFHLQNAWNVQSTEELGRYLDISTRTNEWNRYSPNRFVRFWREECGNTSVITPEIIRKYIGQYQRWEAQQLVAA
jgi:hypothetical protein